MITNQALGFRSERIAGGNEWPWRLDCPDSVGYPCRMLPNINLDDLAKRLSSAVPPGISALGADLDKTFHAILQGAFEKMNLVSREEFEAQKSVLARTREKLETLEARVAELERRIPPS